MQSVLEKLRKDTDVKSSIIKEIKKNEMREEFSGAFEKNTFVKTGFQQSEIEDMKIWQEIRKEDNESDESSDSDTDFTRV